ncbi:preprotein translocase subunit SecE [Stomatohabitans albus]|uniref:preprotein translocase subunit SecE n=1 Tax=Stomatohabitans albus TaxID=3110766 RepID=UPI00300D7213
MSDLPTQDVATPEKAGGPLGYLQQVREELRKVYWPTKMEVAKMSLMVILVTVVVGALVVAMDYLFGQLALTIFGG